MSDGEDLSRWRSVASTINDDLNPRLDYGLTNFDNRHAFTAGGNWKRRRRRPFATRGAQLTRGDTNGSTREIRDEVNDGALRRHCTRSDTESTT